MKPVKCYFVVNTRWGYCCASVWCDSIRKAVDRAKNYCGFAYRVFNENGKEIRRGFCK